MRTKVAPRAELLKLGWTSKQIEANVASGVLTRVGHGWFALPEAEPWVVEAVKWRGRLGCLSGCRFHGLWTTQHGEPHIVVGYGAAVGSRDWHRHRGPLPPTAVFPLEDCLAQVIQHHSPEQALMVLESAANQGKITPTQGLMLIAAASGRKQRVLKFFNPLAESGSETRVRAWLQQQRFPVQPQVWIPGVGRVDLLVGRSLILECDSAQYHAYRDNDYARQLAARDLGYTTLNLSFSQVHHTWDATQMSLLRELGTGAHLREPKT